MSDHIPFQLQVEIIKRLHVKSLIRFRSVSKAWKSLIDSPQFIAAHSACHAHSHHLLVRYPKRYKTYVSIVDDNTFPQQKFDLPVPSLVKLLKRSKVVGSCDGLFCLSGYYEIKVDSVFNHRKEKMAVLWNPSIRKSIAIAVPSELTTIEAIFGFGVCPVTSDPKIFLASKYIPGFPVIHASHILGEVKVFTLSSGAWRSTNINLPFEVPVYSWSQAVVDGFIYWLFSYLHCGGRTYLLISFDLANDDFREVYLPDRLAYNTGKLSVCKLRDSLAVIEPCTEFLENQCYEVWMIEDGVPNSLLKMFTIKVPDAYLNYVLGFRKNGEPILDVQNDLDIHNLAVYNPYSKRINWLESFGHRYTFSAYSYTETLLLLNHKEFDSCLAIAEDENND